MRHSSSPPQQQAISGLKVNLELVCCFASSASVCLPHLCCPNTILAERVVPDTRAAHFVLGDDKTQWDTASSATYGGHQGYSRVAPLKPAASTNISLGTAPVSYKSSTAAAFSGSSAHVHVTEKPASAGKNRSPVLWDDLISVFLVRSLILPCCRTTQRRASPW
jgi:hypothetical protein